MSRFKDYATSTAFSLSLSRSMCEALEYIVIRRIQSRTSGMKVFLWLGSMATIQSLERRGLVVMGTVDAPSTVSLTEAGEALYPLLVMAGLCRTEQELAERYASKEAA